MGFSRQEYGVGCHALLQWIFPTQGSNPSLLRLLRWRESSLPLRRWESPKPWKPKRLLFKLMYMKCPEQANPQRQKADLCLPGAGRRKDRAGLLMGTGFLSGGMKMFCNQW